MKPYHKIQTVFLRDPETKYVNLLPGQYSKPEFKYLKRNDWLLTEKIDGTNVRVIYNYESNKVELAGRTDRSQLPPKLIKRLYDIFEDMDHLRDNFGDSEVCLYGEGFGDGIQKAGKSYSNEQDFILFDVMINGVFLDFLDMQDVARKLGIESVPLVAAGHLEFMVDYVKSGFKSAFNGEFIAEGVVARPEVELLNKKGERVVTKLKHKDFRLL